MKHNLNDLSDCSDFSDFSNFYNFRDFSNFSIKSIITSIVTGVVTGIFAGALHGQPKPVFRDAATNEQLSEQYRSVSLENPMKNLPADKGEDPSVVNHVGNLLENSELITFNGQTTLVPKNALVLVPAKLKGRVNNHQSGCEIVSWVDFYSVNRGWISTVEVTFSQARGDEPVAPETLANLGKSGNLIVAVLKSGPISVMPPKPENPIQTASQETQP